MHADFTNPPNVFCELAARTLDARQRIRLCEFGTIIGCRIRGQNRKCLRGCAATVGLDEAKMMSGASATSSAAYLR